MRTSPQRTQRGGIDDPHPLHLLCRELFGRVIPVEVAEELRR
jgi:hypothetical protein